MGGVQPPPPTGPSEHPPVLQRRRGVVGQGHGALGGTQKGWGCPHSPSAPNMGGGSLPGGRPYCAPPFNPKLPPLTASPSRAQALPLGTNLPWLCRFFCPPSANLQSRGSGGAAGGAASVSRCHHPPPPTSSLPPPRPTWHPRGGFDVLPVEVGDDGLALLRRLHPGGGGSVAGAWGQHPGPAQPPPSLFWVPPHPCTRPCTVRSRPHGWPRGGPAGCGWRPPARRASAAPPAPARPPPAAGWRCRGWWGPAPVAAVGNTGGGSGGRTGSG